MADFARTANTRRWFSTGTNCCASRSSRRKLLEAEGAVAIVAELREVVAAAPRSVRIVAPVVLGEGAGAQEIRLHVDPGRLRRRIDRLGRGVARIGAAARRC